MTQVLGRALVRAGHEVRVAGMYPASYPALDYEEDSGVRVWRLRRPAGRFDWVAARYRLFRKVARWSRDGEIDLVEVPDWGGLAAGWPQLPVPVIVRLNGSISYFAAELERPIRRAAFWLERASLRRADFGVQSAVTRLIRHSGFSLCAQVPMPFYTIRLRRLLISLSHLRREGAWSLPEH